MYALAIKFKKWERMSFPDALKFHGSPFNTISLTFSFTVHTCVAKIIILKTNEIKMYIDIKRSFG